MSLFFRSAAVQRVSNIDGPPLWWGEYPGATADQIMPPRSMSAFNTPMMMPNSEMSLRHSAVWACLRLRANLISTFPIDVYRKAQYGLPHTEISAPPIITNPGGDRVDYMEWMYSTQFDLDRCGNSIGIISKRNAFGLPAQIDLVPMSWVSINVKDTEVIQYYIRGEIYDPSEIWHEKQYTVAGLHVGLSPIAYAAWSIGEYLSIQDFALSWFTSGGIPRSHLKNETQATITDTQADHFKAKLKQSVSSGDALVTGKDWSYNMIMAEQTGMEWIEARKLGPTEISRFFDCPADLIDAAVSGSSVTYANIAQRNLQFLIMSLGPAIIRRENSINKLLPNKQFVKLSTDALLRMDPLTRAQMLTLMVTSRLMTPSEARLLDDRGPYTSEQLAEFDRFWPAKSTPTAPAMPFIPA